MSLTRSHPKTVILLSFLLLKLYHFLILSITSTTFDLSSTIQPITPGIPILNTILNRLIHWDAVYFAKLIQYGIDYEHEWVFSPFWWRFVTFSHGLINDKLLGDVLGSEKGISSLALGLLISNVSQLASAYVLYYLTKGLFGENSGIALKSSVLFVWSSIGIFSTSLYSENLNTLLIFVGFYLKFLRSDFIGYVSSSVFFSLAFMTRSNTIVVGFLYVYDLVKFKSFKALVSGGILGLAVVLVHIFPYLEYCVGFDEKLGQRPWCLDTIPSIFSFAQSNYWDVGFLKYWTLGNIPNFLFGLPEILLLFKSSLHFLKSSDTLKSLSLMNFLFLIIVVFFVHVQIVLRISSFVPLQFWYLASLLVNNQGQYWISWLFIWNLVEPILFTAFLPPA